MKIISGLSGSKQPGFESPANRSQTRIGPPSPGCSSHLGASKKSFVPPISPFPMCFFSSKRRIFTQRKSKTG